MPNQRKSNKKQVTLWVKSEQLKEVKRLAERTGTNVSQLLQDLVAEELALTTAEQRRRAVDRFGKQIAAEPKETSKG